MTEEEFAQMASRRQMESYIENGFQGITELVSHTHEFIIPAEPHLMTIQQLRKLVLYRADGAFLCVCGMVALTDFTPFKVYSRNGNIVRDADTKSA